MFTVAPSGRVKLLTRLGTFAPSSMQRMVTGRVPAEEAVAEAEAATEWIRRTAEEQAAAITAEADEAAKSKLAAAEEDWLMLAEKAEAAG